MLVTHILRAANPATTPPKFICQLAFYYLDILQICQPGFFLKYFQKYLRNQIIAYIFAIK